ncbi:unnamed protein product [Ixodes pacificus]
MCHALTTCFLCVNACHLTKKEIYKQIFKHPWVLSEIKTLLLKPCSAEYILRSFGEPVPPCLQSSPMGNGCTIIYKGPTTLYYLLFHHNTLGRMLVLDICFDFSFPASQIYLD